ncbi:hypothetical protein VTN02DRAFT_3976 [Thermoascus thermophilus]
MSLSDRIGSDWGMWFRFSNRLFCEGERGGGRYCRLLVDLSHTIQHGVPPCLFLLSAIESSCSLFISTRRIMACLKSSWCRDIFLRCILGALFDVTQGMDNKTSHRIKTSTPCSCESSMPLDYGTVHAIYRAQVYHLYETKKQIQTRKQGIYLYHTPRIRKPSQVSSAPGASSQRCRPLRRTRQRRRRRLRSSSVR